MRPDLPAAFLGAPLAHRALHDVTDARPENSRAAIQAAIDAGYGIEIDLQQTSDGRAQVFHDYDLHRLTGRPGVIRSLSEDEARATPLLHGDGESIPGLPEVLGLVAGKVPLLIEIKDQDGGMGPNVAALEQATAKALQGYDGPVAVMSFNPHSVAEMAKLAPDIPRGLVTSAYGAANWPLSAATRNRLRGIPDFDAARASFISHQANDLDRPRVAELKASGVPILCWTIRSPEQEAKAREIAHNVTFEGYLAAHPG